ncbi:MAG: NADH-quinone oxidoreductase subunit NuoB [Firmicutes bacterium]|nr:NADH-quinone oxidoreductase subunit NuoB [Bacillota bacterium]
MLGWIVRGLAGGRVTTRYPFAADDFRVSGVPEIDPEACGGLGSCRLCLEVCPTAAVGLNGAAVPEVDARRCILCARCVEACPRGALRMVPRVESALVRGPVPRLFCRSLFVRHVDAGSCNACESELAALTNPFYDVSRLGIFFVTSPRHADLLVVTGPVTVNMAGALERTYAAMPGPKLVMAVGACACGGGLVGKSYATHGGVDRVLPVDLYVPGCPPPPLTLIDALLRAAGRSGRTETQKEVTCLAGRA